MFHHYRQIQSCRNQHRNCRTNHRCCKFRKFVCLLYRYHHMWTQFYLGGQWVDFDAALGESECSPTRLALMTSSLQETSMSELGLALLDLIGQITVEVDSVK